jgi:hypothetical protein
MPFRISPYEFPDRAKIQFTTSSRMPSDIYNACLVTNTISNTVYCQHALVDALSRDLGIDRATLLGALPPPRGPAQHLYDPAEATMSRYRRKAAPITVDGTGGVRHIGPANTHEEVK